VKDFTKTQKKADSDKQHLKCNKCGVTTLSFGVETGDRCSVPLVGAAGMDTQPTCSGTLRKVSSESVDRAKRRSDGSAG
jgi:hypothetical protein